MNVVICPYYCDAELARYLRVAEVLRRFGPQTARYEFLLAASPRIAIDEQLHRTFSELAPTTSYQCPTQIFGYPHGPTAMFWDCMDFIAQRMNRSPGFSLWLESDMTIVKPDWMDRLAAEWDRHQQRQATWVMGNWVPDVYRKRIFRRAKRLLGSHVNGGACYSKDFVEHMPAAARQGVFDMAIYPVARAADAIRHTGQICFSTVARARRDVADPSKVVLHGFMQDKDAFVDRCCQAALSPTRFHPMLLRPLATRLDLLRRQVNSYFIKRGPRAMLDHVLLTQDLARRRRAA